MARAGTGWSHSLPYACLAEVHLLAGRVDEAEREAVRALEFARAKGERGIEAWILRALGEIGTRADAPRPAALDAYRDALALADHLDMRPLIALCHLGMGTLHQRLGPPERAHEHLADGGVDAPEHGHGALAGGGGGAARESVRPLGARAAPARPSPAEDTIQ